MISLKASDFLTTCNFASRMVLH